MNVYVCVEKKKKGIQSSKSDRLAGCGQRGTPRGSGGARNVLHLPEHVLCCVQWCPILWDLLADSSVHGISQARTRE